MNILNYRIDKIVTKDFKLKETNPNDDLRFSLSFQVKVSMEESAICCISEFQYSTGTEIVMGILLESYFKIANNGLNSLINGNLLTIDPETLQYLATIAVGTARGEIHARCEMAGSPLQHMVLPPVDLTKIITAPSEFQMNPSALD